MSAGSTAGSWLKSASIWTTHRRAAGEGDAEAVEVGPAESLLGGPMSDADRAGRPRPARRRCRRSRRATRRRRRGSWPPGSASRMAARDRADVLGLVVGGQDDPRPGPAVRGRRSSLGKSTGAPRPSVRLDDDVARIPRRPDPAAGGHPDPVRARRREGPVAFRPSHVCVYVPAPSDLAVQTRLTSVLPR